MAPKVWNLSRVPPFKIPWEWYIHMMLSESLQAYTQSAHYWKKMRRKIHNQGKNSRFFRESLQQWKTLWQFFLHIMDLVTILYSARTHAFALNTHLCYIILHSHVRTRICCTRIYVMISFCNWSCFEHISHILSHMIMSTTCGYILPSILVLCHTFKIFHMNP